MMFNVSSNFTSQQHTSKFAWSKEISNLTVVIISFTGQLLLFIAMYRHRNLRSIPNLIILNLSVADCLFSACETSVILYFLTRGKATLLEPICPITGVGGVVFAFASINTLVFVSIERYMATNYPLKHRVMFNHKFVRTSLVAVWCLSALESALPFATSRYAYVEEFLRCVVDWNESVPTTLAYLVSGIILPLAILIYCNVHILRAIVNRPVTLGRELSARLKAEREMSILVVVVIGTFFVCWVPYSVAMICLLKGKCFLPQRFMWVAAAMASCNSACNPIIYGIMNKNFRKAFSNILRCK